MEKSCLLWKRKSYEKPGMSTKLQNVGEGGGGGEERERTERKARDKGHSGGGTREKSEEEQLRNNANRG